MFADTFMSVTMHKAIARDQEMEAGRLDKVVIPAKGEFEFRPHEHFLLLGPSSRHCGENERLRFVLSTNELFEVDVPVGGTFFPEGMFVTD
ncbi:hypothetical protein ACIO6U_18630 [Streptomyces sp. NPDC087422]|uniref:hypothetical protein n=1 Tax=Streptomyces sp. NPDC087422 TaxID=3365786 RepID=UPI003801A020